MKVKIKIDSFEGPLDLLLHLVEKSKIDIAEVSITDVIDQFISIMYGGVKDRLDLASEFLLMAATLTAIKSRMLLPRPLVKNGESEADPREELVDRLLRYKHFMRLGKFLLEKEEEQAKVYTRLPQELPMAEPALKPGCLSVDQLFRTMVQLLNTREPQLQIENVGREEFSVQDQVIMLEKHLLCKSKCFFSELIKLGPLTREFLVTCFLALLELVRLGKVICYQSQTFADICIEKRM